MCFVTEAKVFPFEAHVIEDLVHEVIIGKNFSQN